MSAPATCIVSGVIYSPGGTAVSGVVIKAFVTRAFFIVENYIPQGLLAQTETDSNGAWSLTLVRTAPYATDVTIRFEYPNGNSNSQAAEYAIEIPNQTSANFYQLVDLSPYN